MKKYNVLFSKRTRSSINSYIEYYKSYYRELFKDSWIWSENTIIEKYIFDSKIKTEEIYDLITKKLSDNFIKYPENIALIKWKSRTIKIYFYDKWENRFISDLQII